MDTSAGAGRDARFNLGYNSMSLLGGDTSPDMYGSGRSSATSLSSHSPSGMSRSGMGGLSGSCAPGGGGLSRGLKRSSSDVCFLDQDVTGRPLDCGSDLMDDGFSPAPQKSGPPPNGKKTKGRVKIKMEYIDNKLRRYTTFSKRKTGIMKKAYELSTLTGTQVMLLVASETGHVYTFATRKLQPMITSEAGKALIQTCLNSPDPCPSSGGSSGNGGSDQRMSATGFEETELSYNIGDDEQKVRHLVYGHGGHGGQGGLSHGGHGTHAQQQHMMGGGMYHQHPEHHMYPSPSHLLPCPSPQPLVLPPYHQPCPSPLPQQQQQPPQPQHGGGGSYGLAHMSHAHPQR
ncbi:serum response factor isoform X1 [Thrips palmi]|uniref:Serum response factor homolog n=1 Tax=Thrips palmi TaxID=161013 RepID=A0A6P9A9S8_THRPL|nr:serum response factor isoform X1 [Thrips palmi]